MSETGHVPAGGMPEQPLAEAEGQATTPPQGYAAEPAPARSPFTFLDDEDDDVLLMPGPQSSWAEAGAHAAQTAQPIQPAHPAAGQPYHAQVPGGYDYVQHGYEGAHAYPQQGPAAQHAGPQDVMDAAQAQPEGAPVAPSWPPLTPPGAPEVPEVPDAAAAGPQPEQGAPQPPAPRRPLHAGPPIPDPSLMTGQVPVRSLADRGPAGPPTPPGGVPVAAVPGAAAPGGSGVEYLDLPEEVRAQPMPQQAEPVIPAQPSPPDGPTSRIAAFLADPAPQAPVGMPASATPAAGTPVVPQQAGAPGAVSGPATAPGPEVVAAEAAAPADPPAAPLAAEPAAGPAAPSAAPAEPQETAVETAPGAGAVQEATAPEAEESGPAGEARAGDVPADGVPPVPPSALPAGPDGQPVQEGGPQAVAAEQSEPPAQAGAQPVQPGPAENSAAAVHRAGQDTPAGAHAAPPAAEPLPEGGSPVEAAAGPDAGPVPEAEPPAGAGADAQGAPTAAADGPAGVPGTAPEAAGPDVHPADGLQAPDAPPAEAAAPAVYAVEQAAGTTGPQQQAPADAGTAAAGAPVAEPAVAEAPAESPVPGTAAAGDGSADAPLPAVHTPSAGPEPSAPALPAADEAVPAAEPPVTEVPPMSGPLVVGADGTVVTPAVPQEPAPAADDPAAEASGEAAPGYDEPLREAVHRVMRERRDVRNGFRPDPIPHEVLLRVLEAAHTAPSVGYSQPWDFVVIRSAKTRRRMHELAMRQRDAYAASLPKGRAKQFKELKIEAILETPVNIVVTADRTRGGRHTLGRHSQPQMAPYSAALAVENLWLAARAEGLGVGWVSFFDEREMVQQLGLPDHLEVVAYLCVGYVDEFPAEPELAQAGWAKKRPLSWVVHEEEYGRRALPGEEPHSVLQETLRNIRPLDAKALGEAWDRQKRMTKPAGSLGMLEIISAQLCGLSRHCPPPVPEPACVAVFAGDHGVHAQGVSPWPQEVTGQMVANILGGGAVINAFAAQIGTEVCVVDVGVAADLPEPLKDGRTTGLLPRKVRPGTGDMTQGPAMTRDEVLRALEVGIETARDLVAAGNRALITGDMGIANTTAAAALISVFTGEEPAVVTGRGTGIDDETHAHKVSVIQRALALHQPDPNDPIGVLAAVGGLEHAAIAGFLLGAASLRTPVILDGVIAGAAALAAKAIAPEVLAACIAGHRSAEPGHKAALAKLGLRPLIDLDLRLGEGSGAILALPLVQAAARAMHDVATFDSAGVTEKQ